MYIIEGDIFIYIFIHSDNLSDVEGENITKDVKTPEKQDGDGTIIKTINSEYNDKWNNVSTLFTNNNSPTKFLSSNYTNNNVEAGIPFN